MIKIDWINFFNEYSMFGWYYACHYQTYWPSATRLHEQWQWEFQWKYILSHPWHRCGLRRGWS